MISLFLKFMLMMSFFGSTNQDFCKEFGDMTSREFEMSTIGELNYFLGLQIKQLKDGTFVSQTRYAKDLIKTMKTMINLSKYSMNTLFIPFIK